MLDMNRKKNNTKPLISVITVCFNSADIISETIESVLNQSYKSIEYIFIDGDSVDTTVKVINSYKDKAIENGAIFKLISEPDNGIYDAMNKGIYNSSGEYIHFLNAGDLFCTKTVLESIAEKLKETNCNLLVGGSIHVDKNFKIEKKYTLKSASSFYRDGKMICHQSIFHKASAFKKYGIYNIKYKFVADQEWVMRFLSKKNIKEKIIYFDNPIIFYDMNGVSALNRKKVIKERKILIKSFNFGKINFLRATINNRIQYIKFLGILILKKLSLYTLYLKFKNNILR
jgi:glycosyltransferase involved in cell wall biosynthesis